MEGIPSVTTRGPSPHSLWLDRLGLFSEVLPGACTGPTLQTEQTSSQMHNSLLGHNAEKILFACRGRLVHSASDFLFQKDKVFLSISAFFLQTTPRAALTPSIEVAASCKKQVIFFDRITCLVTLKCPISFMCQTATPWHLLGEALL